MNRLAPEILCQIFSHLHRDQKAKCKQVCRQWSNAIDSSSLFHTMRVSTSVGLLTLLRLVDHEPNLADQIKRLVCNVYIANHAVLSMLPKVLPNLKAVCFEECEPNEDLEPLEYHPWTKSLQVFVETKSDQMASQLLESGKCLALKTLVMEEYGDVLVDENDTSAIFDLLVNAPTLTTLKLMGYTLTLDQLNQLDLPYLKSLSLINCILIDTTVTGMIQPAPCVNVLMSKVIIYQDQAEIEPIWLDFITKKYPSLIEMEHVSCIEYRQFLSYDNVILAWSSILTTLRLKTLMLPGCEIGFDMWTMLEQADCQLEKLGLCFTEAIVLRESLLSPNQMECIQTLVIEHRFISTLEYGYLKDFKQLKKLKLIFYRGTNILHLPYDFMQVLPDSLEALSFKSIPEDRFDYLKFIPKMTCLFSIKSVTFSNIHITAEVELFLAHGTPNLNRLKLHNCKMDTPTLSLPNTRFMRVQISCDFDTKRQGIRITTLTDGETHCYRVKCKSILGKHVKHLFDTHDIDMYPRVDVITDSSDNDPYLWITCFSVQDLIIIDYR